MCACEVMVTGSFFFFFFGEIIFIFSGYYIFHESLEFVAHVLGLDLEI